MTTSTLDVGNLFSVLGAHGIERQLQRLAGIGRMSANPVSGSTTVEYDPGKTNPSAIKTAIEECGWHPEACCSTLRHCPAPRSCS